MYIATVALGEIRPRVHIWRPQLYNVACRAVDALDLAQMRLDVHMSVYRYKDVVGTGPGRLLCTLGWISLSAAGWTYHGEM